MRILYRCLLITVLVMGLIPTTAVAKDLFLTIQQVENLPYGTAVYGYSTLDPTGPKRFKARLLGVLRNARGSGLDLIAVELNAKTNSVVAGGQSGSPMFIDIAGISHKIGTLSFGASWAINPIAYLTPIHDVLMVQHAQAAVAGARTPSPVSLMIDTGVLSNDNPIRVMLQAGATSGVSVRGKPDKLQAGSMLGVQLAWGDFDFTASGTVSHIDGDKIFMFGHPFLQLGPAEYRLVPVRVLTVQQSYERSYVLSVPIQGAAPVGVITQDRQTAIYGQLGKEPTTAIPISVEVTTSSGEVKKFNFFSIADPTLAPHLISMGVVNAVQSWSRERGDMTLFMNGSIEIEGSSSIDFSESFTSISGLSSILWKKTSSILDNRFTKARITKVSIQAKVFDEYRRLSIESATLDKPNVKPGETVKLRVTLSQPLKGSKTVDLEIVLPQDLQFGVGKIVVGNQDTIGKTERGENNVVNLSTLVESLNQKRRPDAMYVYIVMPPSKVAPGVGDTIIPLLVGEIKSEIRKTSKRLSSNVEEYQILLSDFQVSGSKELEFKVGTGGDGKPINHP